MRYVIGTRGSKLALAQTKQVCAILEEKYKEDTFEIKIIKTKGDQIQDRPLHQIGDKGLFVKEIEEQLLSGAIDLAVHSMKDMPAQLENGLVFAKTWTREDERDVLILREKSSLEELEKGAVIGTGSLRRGFQLKRLRSDLKIVDIRGNVDTRLRKMQELQLDGIVLAAAGLKRLGMEDRITCYFEPEEMVCAPAQGALALELREDDKILRDKLDAFCDEQAHQRVLAERTFLSEMNANCHVPIGAACKEKEDGTLWLKAVFGDENGERFVVETMEGSNPIQLGKSVAEKIKRKLNGTVFLVGAGPGDPDLITKKGLDCIKEADCIVYDRLASPQLLSYGKETCECIYVGKENRHHTMKQEEINELLVKKAREYKKVVRLKGGDVYVFGRGGEEGIYLRQHQIAFEVVPGISSSIAGPAYAGIPVTHRGIATGFHVVTAHNQQDQLANLDFEAMAKGTDTCIFLMGLSKLSEITQKLLDARMKESTPVAVISHATMPTQKVCIGDLTTIVEKTREKGVTSPALIVVGNVVNLRNQLSDSTKEQEKSYVVTKVGKEESRLTKILKEQGYLVSEIQTGEIRYLSAKWTKEDVTSIHWLVFTSRHGVQGFFENYRKLNYDLRWLAQTKIVVVGEKTAKALERYGILADVISRGGNSASVGAYLKNQIDKNDNVWYAKAAGEGAYLQETLKDLCHFQSFDVYENCCVANDIDVAMLKQASGIFFTCGSSATRIFGEMPAKKREELKGQTKIYSMGEKTTEALNACGITNVIEAKQSSYEALARLLD